MYRVRIQEKATIFIFSENILADSGYDPASYLMGIGGSFSGVKPGC